MIIGPERYRADALAINNFQSWDLFMKSYFDSVVVKDYPSDFKKELIKANSARLGNLDYLRFSALVYMNAATLGFIEAAGGASRHRYRRYEGSFTDPVHLWALDNYLANANIETAIRKEKIIKRFESDYNRSLTDVEIERVWGIVPDIEKGEVKQVLKPRNLNMSVPRVRVCLPDLPYLEQIASARISSNEAGRMTGGEFVTTQLPLIEKVYGGFVDVHKVFFGPGEKWARAA
jgi:hypothetical protein